MESLDKINLDVNTMLINWGLILGRYQDGVIRTTKFGQLNMTFAFILFLFEAIKWFILMFCSKESQMSNYLGEFTQYYGPKVVVDFICFIEAVNSVIIILLFYLMQNKMLFWLEHMEFNAETRYFHKLNLNVFHSKRFTKQFALLWLTTKNINYSMLLVSFTSIWISFMIFKNYYHLYFSISTFEFCGSAFYMIYHSFGLTFILYQVKINFLV